MEHVIGQDENFCFRRTRAYKVGGSTDPSAPFANAFFTQSDDGTSGFTNQPCVDLPDGEFYQYGPVTIGADSHMVRKDGCEFDATGQPGVPGVWYWDGSSSFFAPPGSIGIEAPDTCATLGVALILTNSTDIYTATLSSGVSMLTPGLTINVGSIPAVVTSILDFDNGVIAFELVESITEPFLNIPAGTAVCPVGFNNTNTLYPQLTPAEMATGPKILVQLPDKSFRRLSDPPSAMQTALLAYDFVTGGYKWTDSSSNTIAYEYTGSDQLLTIPPGVSQVTFFAWGAGGSDDGVNGSPSQRVYGGVGGYVWGTFTVSPGDVFAVMVGQGASVVNSTPTYGFGGAGQNPNVAGQRAGGGLSGVFSGAGAIVSTDTARAQVVAGGGGAAGRTDTGGNKTEGGNGGDPGSAGGSGTMAGANATGGASSGTGGGGGGFAGGTGLGLAGKGGTNYLNPASTAGAVGYAIRPSKAVPGASTGEYQSGAGQPQANGFVFVSFA